MEQPEPTRLGDGLAAALDVQLAQDRRDVVVDGARGEEEPLGDRRVAEPHPQRSVITRALGTDPDVDVDAFTVEIHDGDVFMLCSDGLTSMVDDDAIKTILQNRRCNLKRAAQDLVKAANRGGGEDNITVLLFEIGQARNGTSSPWGSIS